MSTVTKKELTDRIADAIGEKRTVVKDIVQRFLGEIVAELAKGNRLEFRDFGVFEVRTRKPRMAQNPRTLERVPVPVKSMRIRWLSVPPETRLNPSDISSSASARQFETMRSV